LQKANDDYREERMSELETDDRPNAPQGKTNSGLDENVAGLLCYVFGIVTGVIFMMIEKENRFVRFHALQSIFVSAAIIVLNIAVNLVPLLGMLISFLLSAAAFILWIVLMVKAYQGQMFKLPIIGDMAEKQLK